MVHNHLRGNTSSTCELRGPDTDALNELRNENQTCFKDSLDATEGLCECEWRLRAEAGRGEFQLLSSPGPTCELR